MLARRAWMNGAAAAAIRAQFKVRVLIIHDPQHELQRC
jgi:hypothetical protein